MNHTQLIAALDTMADPTVAPYQNKIVSDTGYPMRCVRVPELRKLAKQAAKGDWRQLLADARWETYEEVLVIGLAIAYAKGTFQEKTDALTRLLPHLDSWALTDSIVPTLKLKPDEREQGWDFAMDCLKSDREYTIRFGIIMLLVYYLTPQDIKRTAKILTAIRDDRYYVRMAAAWCLAELGTHDYSLAEEILKAGVLDTFTHNMTIRKLRESYRITPEQKAAAAALRRKENRT